MRVKTITCHNVYNYGASLQAYALQKYIESLGHDIEIIDYLPNYIADKTYKPFKNFWILPKQFKCYNLCKKSIVFKWLYCLTKQIILFYKTYFIGRKKAFDRFSHNFLRTTSNRYTTHTQLRMNPPEADIYIAGSDQIWNTKYGNGKDPSFFLDFGSPKTIRVSYAASFGISELSDGDGAFIKEQLSRFSAISVRESSGVNIVENLGLSAEEVLDPVFLLDKKEWLKICSDNIIVKKSILQNKKYIIIYDLGPQSQEIKECAVWLARKHGVNMYSINAFRSFDYVDKNIKSAGPQDFVALIANAQFVVTNSFHATAFAIIFNKVFYSFNKNVNSSRLADCLRLLGLGGHFNVTKYDDLSPQWDTVNHLKKMAVEKSSLFLVKCTDEL